MSVRLFEDYRDNYNLLIDFLDFCRGTHNLGFLSLKKAWSNRRIISIFEERNAFDELLVIILYMVEIVPI